MTAQSRKLLIPLAAFLVFSAGCATKPVKMYEGSELTLDRVGVIQSAGALKTVLPNSASVLVTHINGKATHFSAGRTQQAIALKPADYEVRVQLSRRVETVIAGNPVAKQYNADKMLKIKVLPGRTYRIMGSLFPEHTFPWYAWVEDAQSGKVIAGTKPVKQ